MPISAKILDVGASLEQIRQEFNNLQSDVNILQQSPTYGDSLIFEGATSDAYETTLSVQDPTADRTVLLPNETGTLLTSGATINATTSAITANNTTNETVYILFADGASGNQGLESDTSLTYNPSTNLLTTGSLVIADAGNIGSASDTDAISISSGGAIQLTQTLDVAGDLTALTLNADGDTAAGDNAAIGYTAAEGLILTGQGSTSDITLKNDADGTVFTVPTGTDDILFPDSAKILMGAGSDLQIYHDSAQSYIRDVGTGSLRLTANEVLINNTNDDEASAKFIENGAVELYYDNTKHLETVSGGGTLTGSWAVTTSLNPDASDGATLGTTALEWSDLYLADGAVIGFGDDQDVTLTHIADTGLLLSGSRQFQFGDSGTYIHQSADGVLDLVSDTEIEINATTIDINGNVEISGTTAQVGVATFTARDIHSGGITIANDGQIGSAGDADAMAISSSGVVTFTQAPVFNNGATLTGSLGVGTAMNPDASDGATLGTTALEWSDLYLADGAQILFGDDQEVTLTHVADTGLLLNSTMKLQFNDASQYIQGASATVLDIAATDEIELNATLVDVNANLDVSGTYTGAGLMTTGGNIIIPNAGNIGSVGDTDSLAIDSSGNVTASQNLTVTGNLTVNGTTTTVATSNTIIGDSLIELNNGAGSNSNDLGIVMERGSTGDNAIFLWDESGDHFSVGTTTATGASTGNLTYTLANFSASSIVGTLSTAAQTNITSLGTLTALTVDNVAINGTTIGHTGDTDLMTLASGVLTVAGRLDVADAIYLTGDEKAIRFYNGSNYVELVAHGSTSANTTFKLPQADGSSGQALVTDASGNLSFAANNVGNATSFTTVANNSTDETTFVVFVDGATGEQGPETDTALTYNPSTGLLSTAALTLTGALTVGGTTTLNGNLVLGDAAADTLTVGATLQGASPLTFEGGTADGNETTFAITDPTADRTITFPDATGTVILSGGTLSGSTITATTAFVPDASDGAALGTSSLEFSDLFLADGAVINFGDDQDVTLTHVADTGLRMEDADKLSFGAGSDLSIWHTGGGNSYIKETGEGSLVIQATHLYLNDAADGAMASFLLDGAVTLFYDTAAKLATTSTGISVTGDVLATDDIYLDSDASVIHFGDDGDVTLTHVADTGILLNSTRQIQFNDASQYICGASATQLDIRATDEIELTATLVDLNGNLEISGTATTTGVHTFTAVPVFPNNTIETADIQADAITGAKIADDAINSEHYTDGSIDTAHIADSQITSAKIADGTIVAGDIASNAVTTAKINADAITAAKIADDVINSEHYVDGSIDTAHIADSQITSAKIADATIVAGDLADGAVSSAKILNGTIVSADLADNAVSTAKIAADAITAAKIADDVINSEHIVADSIDAEHYAAGSVDATAIANDAVNSQHYAADSIDTEHYAAGSVDATALGADCVTAAKIGDNVINSEHYAADSIDEEHLANDCVGSAELKTLSTLLIKNSSGTTLKTVHGAGA